MSASVHSRSEPSPPPDEQSPLLSNGKTQDQDNGTLEHGADRSEHGDGETDVPIAEEPSTAKLLVVLSSVWLGCFLAALGMGPPTTRTALLSGNQILQ